MDTENNTVTTSSEKKQHTSKRNKVKEQRTIMRKRDKALLAALGVFIVVLGVLAVVGMLTIEPPKQETQGQVDCEQVRVSGMLPGRLVKIYVHEGDYVHKGDTLAAVDSKTLDAKLYQARSAQRAAQATVRKAENGTRSEVKEGANSLVEQAEAARSIAEKTFQRMDNLFKEGVITEQKRDEAKAALDAATAAVAAAKSQAKMAQNGAQNEDKDAARSMEDVTRGTVMEVESILADQVLVAPCDGEVSEIYPHEGELVGVGTPIMMISKTADVWVSFSVREEKLADMPMNGNITVMVPALKGKELTLKIFYIHDKGSYAVWNATKAYGDYDSKTFEVKARPVKPCQELRAGMSAILK